MPRILRVLPIALAICLLAAWLVSCGKKSPTSVVGELNGNLPTTGSVYPHTFATAGTFNYKCTLHPNCGSLAGTIVVLALGSPIQNQNRSLDITQSGGVSGPYGSTCASLSLLRDSVFVGDIVTWTNRSSLPHTVTSE